MLHLIAVLLGVSPVPASHQPKALDRASKVPLPIHHTLQNAFCFVNIVRNAVSYPEFFDVPHRRIRAWEEIIIILTNNRSFWQIFLPSSGSENKTRNSLPTLLLWRQLHPSCKACWPVNLPMSMQNWLVLAMAPPSPIVETSRPRGLFQKSQSGWHVPQRCYQRSPICHVVEVVTSQVVIQKGKE